MIATSWTRLDGLLSATALPSTGAFTLKEAPAPVKVNCVVAAWRGSNEGAADVIPKRAAKIIIAQE